MIRLAWLVDIADYHKELWSLANDEIEMVSKLLLQTKSIMDDHSTTHIEKMAKIREDLKGGWDGTEK